VAAAPPSAPSCFFDTNVVAAYILGEEELGEIAGRLLHSCRQRGASIITLHEIAHLLLRRGLDSILNAAIALLEQGLRLHSLNRTSALLAAQLRRHYRLPQVGALILATAVDEGHTAFYSFDSDFKPLDGAEIENKVTTTH
jgi:predicted nucleic acid-binding protein